MSGVNIYKIERSLELLSERCGSDSLDAKLEFILDICRDLIRNLNFENESLKKENEMLQAVVDGINSREVKKL